MTTIEPLILDAAIDASCCGHKAATLAVLRLAGHNVPDGFVIPVGGSYAPELLTRAMERLGPGPYAVRSSGVAEDLPDASHAGQYESVLGVSSLDDVSLAAARVLASGDGSPVGVLVQRLVAADCAGVMFSANPVTGDDEVVIETVRGLGDRLMAGDVSGDRWIGRGAEVEAVADTGVIPVAVARQLVALARRIARERGCPQDIEWAIADGEVHVLQARPITELPLQPAIPIPPGRWMKDVSHFNGPLTPIGASILLPVYESALAATFEEFGMPLQTIRQRSFGGEVYTQDVDVTGKHDPGAAPPWWVLAIAVRVIPAMRRRMRAAREAIESGKLELYPRRWEESWRDECMRRIEAARAVDLAAMKDEALLEELRRVVDDVMLPHMVIHFQLTVPYMVGLYELASCCDELLGHDLGDTMKLLTGLSSASTAATRDLSQLSLEAWLERWGDRALDSDPGSPTYRERRDLVAALARQAPVSSSDGEAKRQAAITAARAALGTAPTSGQRERFDAALAYAEIVYPLRDDNVEVTEHLPCGLARRVLVEIGKRLVAADRLRCAEDVVFLEVDELRPALSGALDAAAKVRRRRAERAWVMAHPGPSIHGPAPVPLPDVRGLPAAARRLMQAAGWSLDHELMPPTATVADDGALLGIGVSPGSYTGPVRVIASETELERLQPGDVLVCPTTHSSWAVVFARVGALVADGGGMLSHPSIIAREHAIPAVVGTGCATTTLRDGQLVTVDGNTGRVTTRSDR